MEVNNVVIRGYQNSDIEDCRGLWCELTERHREIYNDPTIGGDDPGKHFDEHLEKVGSDRIWVAERDGKVVGMTGLMGKGMELEIEPVVVTTSERGKGIGKMLLKHVIQEAEKIGVKFLLIRPVLRNHDAIRLFHKAGFNNVGRIEFFMDLREKKGDWHSRLNLLDLEFNY